MKAIFTSGDGAEDMISWARKLDGLGMAVTEIAEARDGAEFVYPILGEIIQEYATALQNVLSEYYGGIRDIVGDFSNPDLKDILHDYNRYKDEDTEFFRGSVLPQETLEKIQAFKDKISPVFEIEADIKKRLDGSATKTAKRSQAGG